MHQDSMLSMEGKKLFMYTSESYMSKRGNTRQGFGGNYRRSGEGSSKPLSPEVSSSKPSFKQESPVTKEAQASDTSSPNISKTAAANVTETVTPVQSQNKPYMEPVWGKRTLYPAASKMKSEGPLSPHLENNSQQNTPSPGPISSSGEGQEESPSVRTCIANFENWSPRSQRRYGQPSVSKAKVSELRESLMQKSNENLADMEHGQRRSSDHDRGSLSSLSHSNESLDERQSAENVSSLSSHDVNTSQPHQEASSQGGDILSLYRNDVTAATRDPHQTSTLSHRDEIILPSLSSTKPTSPTLESGYNSHNTPDNRSVVSELSLGSAGSGSLSITSRNSSNVSKDSVEFPIVPHSVTVVHVRQKSMEEIECEQQVAQIVRQLPETEKKRISEVILPPPEHKTATDYMSGLFDTRIDDTHRTGIKGNHSNQSSVDMKNKKNESIHEASVPVSSTYWSPPGGQELPSNERSDPDSTTADDKNTLMAQKTELIKRIEKKLQVLEAERTGLEQEVEENNNIGRQISSLVETKAPNRHIYRKFEIYLEELDTVLKLLLKVSGQLARAENAVMSLPEGCDNKEMMSLRAKRDDLSQKHEDAKQLKESIDMRSKQVASSLKECLTAEEYTEYEYFIKMKSKLKLEQQEINDKISLGEEQLAALKKML